MDKYGGEVADLEIIIETLKLHSKYFARGENIMFENFWDFKTSRPG